MQFVINVPGERTAYLCDACVVRPSEYECAPANTYATIAMLTRSYTRGKATNIRTDTAPGEPDENMYAIFVGKSHSYQSWRTSSVAIHEQVGVVGSQHHIYVVGQSGMVHNARFPSHEYCGRRCSRRWISISVSHGIFDCPVFHFVWVFRALLANVH